MYYVRYATLNCYPHTSSAPTPKLPGCFHPLVDYQSTSIPKNTFGQCLGNGHLEWLEIWRWFEMCALKSCSHRQESSVVWVTHCKLELIHSIDQLSSQSSWDVLRLWLQKINSHFLVIFWLTLAVNKVPPVGNSIFFLFPSEQFAAFHFS